MPVKWWLIESSYPQLSRRLVAAIRLRRGFVIQGVSHLFYVESNKSGGG